MALTSIRLIVKLNRCYFYHLHRHSFKNHSCCSRPVTIFPHGSTIQEISRRFIATGSNPNTEISYIRNIGIMAHIDAGKTTTTERMLYYSGTTRHLGDVDDGDTVTDYMPQERDRGITITSAAVTFFWNDHRVNLIDTPGHVDFTVEVERSLRVLDGAVAVFDASQGVEAQTLAVWRQADRYGIPRLAFINKMDKVNANYDLCLNSIREKLQAVPLSLQMPIGQHHSFSGVIDLVAMEMVTWQPGATGDNDGRIYSRTAIAEDDDVELWLKVSDARSRLIEQLMDLDEEFAEPLLQDSDVDYNQVPAQSIRDAVKRLTLRQKVVPVLCGSSLRNKGVQLLMDAINMYLPSPNERQHEYVHLYEKELCAYCFKITHDKQRGALVFLRIYSGILKPQSSIYNANRSCTERISRLLWVLADNHREVQSMSAGNIAVAVGLKQTVTGDTLVSSKSALNAAHRSWKRSRKSSRDSIRVDDVGPLLGSLDVPEPVFFCTIEPVSQAYQAGLETALQRLQREDPSLRVSTDTDTGQTLLSGMGELHLEIVLDRIRREYRIDADVGPLQIAYRERITTNSTKQATLDRVIGEHRHLVTITLSLQPKERLEEPVTFDISADVNAENCGKDIVESVRDGVMSASQQGPLIGFPVVGIHISLESIEMSAGTAPAMVSACACQCLHSALRGGAGQLLEPMMHLEIVTDGNQLGDVLSDLNSRRGQIIEIENRDKSRVVVASTPLAEMLGYASSLRSLTSGTATFSLKFTNYEPMDQNEQNRIIKKTTGFS